MIKTISSLRNEGITFKGFLYAGIMLKDGEPYVLEYNVRMGDPECQPILMRMDSDLFQYLVGSVDGTLEKMLPISWKKQICGLHRFSIKWLSRIIYKGRRNFWPRKSF